MRVVQISDIHLSPTHGFFVTNWWNTVRHVNTLRPDFVVVSGDLAINGPDDARELAFARTELERLAAPWRAIPGNHDVGDEPPGQDDKQLVTPERLERWRAAFGEDHWTKDLGDWRLIGLNAQLFGGGLKDDGEQREWLDGQLNTAASKNVGVFVHKPLFVQDIADPASPSCVTPVPRGELIALLRSAPVRFVASGHLHCFKRSAHQGLDLVWAPSSGFLFGSRDGKRQDHVRPGTTQELGVLVYEFDGNGYRIELDSPPGLERLHLADIKQDKYPFLRDMPPYFPEERF